MSVERLRIPTEVVIQNRSEHEQAFWNLYRTCVPAVLSAERDLENISTEESLVQLKQDLEERHSEIIKAYEQLQRSDIPMDISEVRTGIDRLSARISSITLEIQSLLAKQDCTLTQPEIESVSFRSMSSAPSRSSTSSKRRESAAKAAALQAELAAQMETSRKEEELLRLEKDEEIRRAEASMSLQRKRKEIEQQELIKQLSIEEAKLKVYEETERLEDYRGKAASLSLHLPVKTEPTLSDPPKPRPDTQVHRLPGLNPRAHEWKPAPEKSEIAALSEALAASVSLSRLPVPEPPVFNGDPLTYPDWLASFSALIENRGISPLERIHYLKRYLGGPAREAVSGYFLLRSENAFERAKAVLEERYGNQFVVSEAFRNKLEAWPKVAPKDSQGLRKFSDFLLQCVMAMTDIQGLQILNDYRENRKLLQKLPDWIVNRWSRVVANIKGTNGSYPDFITFAKFIAKEADIVCDPVISLESLKNTDKEKPTTPRKRQPGASALSTETQERQVNQRSVKQSCILCKREGHTLHDCRTFTVKPLTERQQFIKKNGLCFGCLTFGHTSKRCPKRSSCKKCGRGHPTCLHEERQNATYGENSDGPNKEVKKTEEAFCGRIHGERKEVGSSMVVPVWVSSAEEPDQEHLVYALLDTQSDTTFILKDTSEKLKTTSEPTQLKLTTMTARDKVVRCLKFKNLLVRGYDSNLRLPLSTTFSRDFIPMEESHIPTTETARQWPHLRGIAHRIHPLMDCEIGLLIGCNCPQALAPRNSITGEGNQPFAVETDLGWSIVGCTELQEESGDAVGITHRVITRQVPENIQLQDVSTAVKFVCKSSVKEELLSPRDIIGIFESDFTERGRQDLAMSQEDMTFLKAVENGINKQQDGHYSMPLPFKEAKPALPNNRFVVKRRLENLKRRFKHDKRYFQDYKAFIEDILEHREAEKVQEQELEQNDYHKTVWYIPHHGVYHPKKPDKLRVVFDCSARFQGTSLNDHLLKGPDLINPLFGVLCRFRQEPVAFMCDIERMFHQFRVNREDQDYFRFLWWADSNIDTEPVDYRMKVHLFGAASSPGCANYALKQVASDHRHLSAEASDFVSRNFYVDDGLKSTETAAKAITLIKDVRSLCAEGKLRLHKFASNSREVMESVPQSERAKGIKDLDLSFEDLPIERALGISWCIESDTFQFRIVLKDSPLTRRGTLSTVASIYDPLGFLAPFTLLGKQILQQMCREKTDWDEPLSEELRFRWDRWRRDLSKLSDIKIQRCYKSEGFGTLQRAELHHFSDASLTGYGQCSYLRLVDHKDQVHCSLVMGKARVTPLKVVTVPRLELQAAVMSVQVSSMLTNELEYPDLTEHFWTDSRAVLGYINNEARRFHIFVANRVQRIRDASQPEQWRYVETTENPADHASRGLKTDELMSSNWFTGPAFLWERYLPAEISTDPELPRDDPEIKKVQVNVATSSETTSVLSRLERFSSWSKAVVAISVLQQRLRGKIKKDGQSTEEDRQHAQSTIIRMVQHEAFAAEMDSLQCASRENLDTSEVKLKSSLHKLDPFVDDCGILRVGGRLKRSSLLYGVKNPIILPRHSHITDLIVKHFHEKTAHQGRGILVNKLRMNGYWIIGCSSLVSSHIFKCVQCRRYRGKAQGQKMADLPKERLEPSPPFTYCGMDCFGPFYVKEGRKELKKYGLLFTCMASRAVHIELLDDMSTDAFLNGLRCFIALRGQVRQIRCDQGTNFVGAKFELKQALEEMNVQRIRVMLTENNCDFVMNSPASSHMGGVWERQIRTVRSVLTNILDRSDARLDTSSLRTFLYESMAIVNSRPITIEDLNDPREPIPITPNHLLTMKSEVVLPPPGNFIREDVYARKRWRRVQYLANEFWKKWRQQYLHGLQSRQKWQRKRRNVRVGDVVILREEELIRGQWRLARVVEVFTDVDGLVRRVRLQIGDSELSNQGRRKNKPTFLERPIHKLTLLLENSEN